MFVDRFESVIFYHSPSEILGSELVSYLVTYPTVAVGVGGLTGV